MKFIKLNWLFALVIPASMHGMEKAYAPPSLREFIVTKDGIEIPFSKPTEESDQEKEKPARKNPLVEYLKDKRTTTYDFAALKEQAKKEMSLQRSTRKNPLEEYLKSQEKAAYDLSVSEDHTNTGIDPQLIMSDYQESQSSIDHNLSTLKQEAQQFSEPSSCIMISDADIADPRNPIKTEFAYKTIPRTKTSYSSYDQELIKAASEQMIFYSEYKKIPGNEKESKANGDEARRTSEKNREAAESRIAQSNASSKKLSNSQIFGESKLDIENAKKSKKLKPEEPK